MKILMISHIELFGRGGGCLENKKYYDGLKYYAKKHNAEIKVISLDEPFDDSFPIHLKKSKAIDILSRICGHSTYLYFEWKKYRVKVLNYKPDIIVLGRSRMGFVAKDIKKSLPMCKVITQMENVELDYVDAYFANTKSLLKRLYVSFEKHCVARDETDAVRYSDALNYLTKRDYIRTHKLYQPAVNHEMILPICIQERMILKLETFGIKNVIFVGSLNYGSNLESIINFVNTVWTPYFSNMEGIRLRIGGKQPAEELVKVVMPLPNCDLYPNFQSLPEIVPKGSMVIAPIKSGAGMKVKVAETLSMGLMIAASDEALVGYESAIKEDYYDGIIRCNTPHEYKEAILKYIERSNTDLKDIEMQNIKLYEKYYSYQVSRIAIENLCLNL